MIFKLTFAAAFLAGFVVPAAAAPKQACHPRAVCLEQMGIPADCKTGVARYPRVSDRINMVVNNCLDKQRR